MEDVKIKLSSLWVAFFFCSIYGDVLRLYDPDGLGDIALQMTHDLMLISAITLIVPIFMGFLSLALKDKTNRWVNIIIGIFFLGYVLIFLISSFTRPAYEIVLSAALVVFAALIIWHAWKWPTLEGQPQ
ncbi:MAG: hypothetical protein ACXAC8_06520 [Candidatus Hodarchaeales archaeon]|jgi:TRAP-type C4-dicarboxylate transport system permease small subunit